MERGQIPPTPKFKKSEFCSVWLTSADFQLVIIIEISVLCFNGKGHKYLLQLTVSMLAAHTGSSHWVVST